MRAETCTSAPLISLRWVPYRSGERPLGSVDTQVGIALVTVLAELNHCRKRVYQTCHHLILLLISPLVSWTPRSPLLVCAIYVLMFIALQCRVCMHAPLQGVLNIVPLRHSLQAYVLPCSRSHLSRLLPPSLFTPPERDWLRSPGCWSPVVPAGLHAATQLLPRPPPLHRRHALLQRIADGRVAVPPRARRAASEVAVHAATPTAVAVRLNGRLQSRG